MTLHKFALSVSVCIFASGSLTNDWGRAADSALSNQQEKIVKARVFFPRKEKNL